MTKAVHQPGCILDPVHWLRHAVAATGRLVHPDPYEIEMVDQTSAELLTDSLAHLAELDSWATITLDDLVVHAAEGLPEEIGAVHCTCGASPSHGA